MKLSDFKKNTPVFTTSYVIDHAAEIVYVSIDEDLDIQMFSEEGSVMDKAKLVSLENMLQLDDSLNQLPGFEKQTQFYRENKNAEWQKI